MSFTRILQIISIIEAIAMGLLCFLINPELVEDVTTETLNTYKSICFVLGVVAVFKAFFYDFIIKDKQKQDKIIQSLCDRMKELEDDGLFQKKEIIACDKEETLDRDNQNQLENKDMNEIENDTEVELLADDFEIDNNCNLTYQSKTINLKGAKNKEVANNCLKCTIHNTVYTLYFYSEDEALNVFELL